MSNYHYYQLKGGEESWQPSPASNREALERDDKPVFITVLAVSKLIDDSDDSTRLTYQEKMALTYEGPFYADWDSEDEALVIEKVNEFLDKLEEMRIDLDQCHLYATGGRGYHLEIPQKIFMEKLPPKGLVGLPGIYREMANALCVDTLDMRVYSGGRGRMWRTPNVKRQNGRYKVSITAAEMRDMTVEKCLELTSAPRAQVTVRQPVWTPEAAVWFDKGKQQVDKLIEMRKKFKPDPDAAKRARCDSVMMAMAGVGLRPDAGFQNIATQLAVAATTAGTTEDQFVADCADLIAGHVSNGNRYNTPAKRDFELRRMYRYMQGNMYYEFSVGALKKLMTHTAPDLDGIPITKEDLVVEIESAKADSIADGEEIKLDEYGDVAKGITIVRHGIYKEVEGVKKRICALSFDNIVLLRDKEQGRIVGYESDIVVNGARRGRQMLELDAFSGLNSFSRMAARYGHAFNGNDADVRTMMMRYVEQANKKGKSMFIAEREGLDVLSLPTHESELLNKPFLAWSDHNGVLTAPEILAAGGEFSYQGHPDPRGVFRTDLAKAPKLREWIEEPGNREALRLTLWNLMSCQKPELLGKVIGWHIACFWKQIFQQVYGKFPLLHVNGAAGVGKTETTILMSSFYNYRTEPRPTSPSSTAYAMMQQMTASASIPLIIDEYKPIEMKPELHAKMKQTLRDAYNQRSVSRGGGSRESDDYRALHTTELSAPVVFIAEAAEDEAAVMERVVLATFSRPASIVGLRNLTKFQHCRQNHEQLGILGQYIAAKILKTVTFESFREEFDELYEISKDKYMLNERDLEDKSLPADELLNKQNAKERSVYNHTVAQFGFQQWRVLVEDLFEGDKELSELLADLEAGIFSRLSDLNSATTPEHIKVLQEIAQMSHSVDDEQTDAIREGTEYAFVTHGGRECIEIAMGNAYGRYRLHCKKQDMKPFFVNKEAFMHSVRDSPTFVKAGMGELLHLPLIYTFDTNELAKFGVMPFRSK